MLSMFRHGQLWVTLKQDGSSFAATVEAPDGTRTNLTIEADNLSAAAKAIVKQYPQPPTL